MRRIAIAQPVHRIPNSPKVGIAQMTPTPINTTPEAMPATPISRNMLACLGRIGWAAVGVSPVPAELAEPWNRQIV